MLSGVAGVSEDELLSALEEAPRVSLSGRAGEGREVRYRFTHAFFRQTLYEEMIAARRLRLHREVAQALEVHTATRPRSTPRSWPSTSRIRRLKKTS